MSDVTDWHKKKASQMHGTLSLAGILSDDPVVPYDVDTIAQALADAGVVDPQRATAEAVAAAYETAANVVEEWVAHASKGGSEAPDISAVPMAIRVLSGYMATRANPTPEPISDRAAALIVSDDVLRDAMQRTADALSGPTTEGGG